MVAGRLGGAEIARTEYFPEGRAAAHAREKLIMDSPKRTTMGQIG